MIVPIDWADLRGFVSVPARLQYRDFIPLAYPLLRAYCTEEPLTEIISSAPWLKALLEPSADFKEGLRALDENYIDSISTILSFDKVLSNSSISDKFRELAKESAWAREALDRLDAQLENAPPNPDTLANGFSHGSSAHSSRATSPRQSHASHPSSPDQIGAQDVRLLRDMLIRAIDWYYQDDPLRSHLSKGVNAFCLAAGLPEANGEDINKNLTALRMYMHSRPPPSHEVALQNEIERLNDIARTQQRIITNLTYRHLMEHLPNPPPTSATAGSPNGSLGGIGRHGSTSSHRPISSAYHWQSFIHTAFARAKEAVSEDSPALPTDPSPHPFEALLRQFPQRSWPQLERIGADLYSAINANVAHFHGGDYTIRNDQWDPMQAAILKAMKPQFVGEDGEVRWGNEAKRYLD